MAIAEGPRTRTSVVSGLCDPDRDESFGGHSPTACSVKAEFTEESVESEDSTIASEAVGRTRTTQLDGATEAQMAIMIDNDILQNPRESESAEANRSRLAEGHVKPDSGALTCAAIMNLRSSSFEPSMRRNSLFVFGAK